MKIHRFMVIDDDPDNNSICRIFIKKIADGAEIRDIQDKRRQFRVDKPDDSSDYTHYMLIGTRDIHNIEVFVLKDYLREKLKLEFRTRQKMQ